MYVCIIGILSTLAPLLPSYICPPTEQSTVSALNYIIANHLESAGSMQYRTYSYGSPLSFMLVKFTNYHRFLIHEGNGTWKFSDAPLFLLDITGSSAVPIPARK